MGLFTPKNNFDCRFAGTVIETSGISSIPNGVYLIVTLQGDTITLSNSDLSFTLNKSQITFTGTYGKRESVTQSKNVIARGMAGGLLLGTPGAIIGGMSGVSGKQKEVQHFFTYIGFISSSNVECRIDFEVVAQSMTNVFKFNETVSPKKSSKSSISL